MKIELISESNNKYIFEVENDNTSGSEGNDKFTIEIYAPNYSTAITRALQHIKSQESFKDVI